MQTCNKCGRLIGRPLHSCPIEVSWVDRFFLRVDKTPTCWLWIGTKYSNGYGDFSPSAKKRHILAHRFSFQTHYGEIPPGLQVCHKCDVRHCVRPDHLFLGTAKDNLHDMAAKGRARIAPPEHRLSTRLNWGSVAQIRSLHKLLTYDELAANYGVSKNTIWQIVTNRAWQKTSVQ